MIAARKRQGKAEEYRRLALAATAQAESCSLPHVREKHEQAAAQWMALAVLDERPCQVRPAQGKTLGDAVDEQGLLELAEDATCIA